MHSQGVLDRLWVAVLVAVVAMAAEAKAAVATAAVAMAMVARAMLTGEEVPRPLEIVAEASLAESAEAIAAALARAVVARATVAWWQQRGRRRGLWWEGRRWGRWRCRWRRCRLR